MFKLIVYCLLTSCLISCSSSRVWDQKSLDSAMQTLENEKKIEYGPQNASQGEETFFVDKTNEYGLEGLSASNLMLVDLNNDNYSDLVLIKEYFSQPEFFLFDIHKQKYVKTDSLFDRPIKASYVLFYDFNGDGIVDALTGVLNQKSEMSERPLTLYEGYYKGGTVRFKEIAGAIELDPGPAATIGLIDFNLDGDLDLFVGNWFIRQQGTSFPAKDFLLENQNGKFVDRSELLISENEMNPDKTMRVNAIPTFASQICDMDLNGFPDILAAGSNNYLNKLWMNRYQVRQGKRIFRDYGVESLFGGDPDGNLNSQGGGRTFSASCADYNNDGIMDAFVGELSHNYDSDSIDRSSILTGSTRKFPPKFIRTEYVL
ncbi:MAG: VCBS repeat-containing protein, partial [Bacteriovoracaceae bacterium]